MATRGKKEFPFRREAKPVINETLFFEEDDATAKNKTKNSKSGFVAPAGGIASVAKGNRTGESLSGNRRKREDDIVEPKIDAASSRRTGPAKGSIDASSKTSGAVEATPVSAKKLKTAAAKPKAHFPVSTYTPKHVGLKKLPHVTVLLDLVQDICNSEQKTLEDYFSNELPGARHEKILSQLRDVLIALPPLVRDECPSDAEFQPELTKMEMVKLKASRRKLAALEASVDKLTGYLEDTDSFLKDFGLLSDQSASHTTKSPKRSSGKVVAGSEHSALASSLATDFNSKLDHMDEQLHQLLSAVNRAAGVSKTALEKQQQLFDGHQKMRRFDTVGLIESSERLRSAGSTTTRPNKKAGQERSDPRQLIRGMPADP